MNFTGDSSSNQTLKTQLADYLNLQEEMIKKVESLPQMPIGRQLPLGFLDELMGLFGVSALSKGHNMNARKTAVFLSRRMGLTLQQSAGTAHMHHATAIHHLANFSNDIKYFRLNEFEAVMVLLDKYFKE